MTRASRRCVSISSAASPSTTPSSFATPTHCARASPTRPTPSSGACRAHLREAAMEQLPAIITKARARLLVRAPFIGSIALGLAWVNAPDIGTMATDGRSVWFNPEWCDGHGVEKTMGVIAHEVLHVVNRHHLRRGERDAELWDVDADRDHLRAPARTAAAAAKA